MPHHATTHPTPLQARCFVNGTGTLLVMWNLHKDLDVSKAGDIQVYAQEGEPRHDQSLRAYAEVLYLKVGAIQPNMRILIKGKFVEPGDG